MISYQLPLVELCNFVRDGVGDVYVGRSVPNPRKDQMVIFSPRGGDQRNIGWMRAFIDCNVWALSDLDADVLSAKVQGLLLSTVLPDPIVDVSLLMAPADIAEPSGATVQFSRFALTFRGQQV